MNLLIQYVNRSVQVHCIHTHTHTDIYTMFANDSHIHIAHIGTFTVNREHISNIDMKRNLNQNQIPKKTKFRTKYVH